MKRFLLACAMLIAGCSRIPETGAVLPAKTSSRAAADQQAAVQPVSARRPIPGAPFTDAGGKIVTMRQFEGQVVVLHLWATWCKPCIHEMPSLDHLADDMPSIKIIPVSEDIQSEQATAFFQQQLIQHLNVYHDPDARLMRELGAYALPMSFLIDRQGRIAAVLKGRVDWHSASIRTLLGAL